LSRLDTVRPSLVGLFLAAAAATVSWFLRWWLFGSATPTGDAGMYLDLARGIEPAPPWSFHVLTPWIAGTLFPDQPARGFLLVGAVSFVGAAAAIERVLALMDASGRERALGVALFLVSSTGAMMARQYLLVDALSYCLLGWSCVWALQGRDLRLAACIAVGVLNRETALFVAPVWFWINRGRGGAIVPRAVGVFLPAAVLYLVLHHTPILFAHPPAHLNYLSPQGIAQLWRANLRWLGTSHRAYGFAICVVMAYGPVWLLATRSTLAAVREPSAIRSRRLLALWTLAAPTAFALAVGVDWRRGFQPLFVPVITSAVLSLRSCAPSRWWVLATVTVVATAAVTEAWWHPPMGPTVVVSLTLWALTAAGVSWAEEVAGRSRAPGRAAALS